MHCEQAKIWSDRCEKSMRNVLRIQRGTKNPRVTGHRQSKRSHYTLGINVAKCLSIFTRGSAVAERAARRSVSGSNVVRITQTDRVSAWEALSATATVYSATCIVLYTHRCSRLNYRETSMRCLMSHTFIARPHYSNNVERVYRKISFFRQSRNKLNMISLFWLCRKNRSTCSIRQCCFDIVADVDGALGRKLYK